MKKRKVIKRLLSISLPHTSYVFRFLTLPFLFDTFVGITGMQQKYQHQTGICVHHHLTTVAAKLTAKTAHTKLKTWGKNQASSHVVTRIIDSIFLQQMEWKNMWIIIQFSQVFQWHFPAMFFFATLFDTCVGWKLFCCKWGEKNVNLLPNSHASECYFFKF